MTWKSTGGTKIFYREEYEEQMDKRKDSILPLKVVKTWKIDWKHTKPQKDKYWRNERDKKKET